MEHGRGEAGTEVGPNRRHDHGRWVAVATRLSPELAGDARHGLVPPGTPAFLDGGDLRGEVGSARQLPVAGAVPRLHLVCRVTHAPAPGLPAAFERGQQPAV